MYMTVNQRLSVYIAEKKIDPPEFYKKIGASRGDWSGWINAGKAIPLNKLQLITSICKDLNVRWLITGEGEMLGPEISDWIVQDQAQPYIKGCAACEAKDLHIRDLQNRLVLLDAQVARLETMLYSGSQQKHGAAS